MGNLQPQPRPHVEIETFGPDGSRTIGPNRERSRARREKRRLPSEKIAFTAMVFVSGWVFGAALLIWALMSAISLDDLVRIAESGVNEKAIQVLVEARALYRLALGMCAVSVVVACVTAARYHVFRR
ncbi:hypothetical protein ACUXPM_003595 [Ralstonia sp. 151470066-2]|jgi:hypothetical protein|uniref:Uncharacterized protein n=2 Tax=Pseudomonadota TaxID=1224 RepID=A0A192A7S5_9RALS|nr:hypothetical protein A9Y76_27965 [Ralstonia insidiosa]MBA9884996.1 hypothetical protein [Ralstonia pickettii]MBA9869712.1 hypothetical protein [Ralstonia insidiosa]MBA9894782.1 hypothetical protein [Ralstonia pickettii]MBB0095197.1 hypothetical protein [Ralstonia pickettii]